MSTDEQFPTGSDPSPQDREVADLLSRALSSEADNVTPTAGSLQKIQARTTGSSPRSRTTWVVATVGAGLAAAAVIVAVVMLAGNGGPTTSPPVATPASHTDTVTTITQHQGVYDPAAPADQQYTVYYAGSSDGPQHPPRLYAETHTVVDGGSDPRLTALNELLTATPIDPSYQASAASAAIATAITSSNGVTTVDLIGPDSNSTLAGLGIIDHSYPSGFAGYESSSLQAIVRTMGADGPVTFTYNHQPIDMFLLQKLPVSPAPDDEVRAWITIDNIVEGQTVSNPVTVEVSGNVFEGNVNWTLTDANGTEVKKGYVTTSMGTWTQAPVKLGTLEAGTYTFTAYEVSPKDGSILNTDDKTFTVQ